MLQEWRSHPATMVRQLFRVEPDLWQEETLEAFPASPRLAMKAAKGPGKTSVLAWLGWNFMLTRPHPKCAATSISGKNLDDNLWAELAKWRDRAELLKAKFTWTKTRIFANDHPETWFMTARSWSQSADRQQQADTLAGLHADYVLFLLDESGGIPDAVMVTAESALSSCVEGHIVQAGNPTHLEGPLWRACSSSRDLWHVVEITGDPDDPRRSPRISADHAREQIRQYGADSPWVLINIFGRFPPASINTLIGPDEVADAMRRHYRPVDYAGAARVLGVDVARYGDDASVIFPRQGLVAWPPIVQRNIDSLQGGGLVARKWGDWDADACFVDNSGGYGAGWIDQLRQLGREPVPVGFADKPLDARYENKRAEMYFELVDWIRAGGALPEAPELTQALSSTTYSFKRDKLILEPKEGLKDRLGFSPDHADALALTFAFPVLAKQDHAQGAPRHRVDYDPLAELWQRPIAARDERRYTR
jgi:hypothetical protein